MSLDATTVNPSPGSHKGLSFPRLVPPDSSHLVKLFKRPCLIPFVRRDMRFSELSLHISSDGHTAKQIMNAWLLGNADNITETEPEKKSF